MLIDIFACIFLVLLIGQHLWYERRIEKLLNRLMAKSLGEFKYYEDAWKKDLEINNAAKEQIVEQAKEEIEKTSPTESKVDLSQFEDDWR